MDRIAPTSSKFLPSIRVGVGSSQFGEKWHSRHHGRKRVPRNFFFSFVKLNYAHVSRVFTSLLLFKVSLFQVWVWEIQTEKAKNIVAIII